MATKVKNSSGLIQVYLSDKEQAAIWKELSVDTSPIGKHSLFTPKDNLEYFIKSEKELAYDKFEAVIVANGKTFNLKYNVCNEQVKTYAAVRKAYGK